MGRKKKKSTKPWCWYCNREFEDEKILLQHQKAKHFKCHICHKKLFTGPGLQIHCMQVHKENIEKVPNSIKGRDNITLEICGMENIPEEDLVEHEKLKQSQSAQSRDENDSENSGNDSDSETPRPPLPPPPPPMPPFPPPQHHHHQPHHPLAMPPLPQGTIHGPLPHLPPPSLMQQQQQPPQMLMNPFHHHHHHSMMMGMNHQMMMQHMNPAMMIPPLLPPGSNGSLSQQQQTPLPPPSTSQQPLPLMSIAAPTPPPKMPPSLMSTSILPSSSLSNVDTTASRNHVNSLTNHETNNTGVNNAGSSVETNKVESVATGCKLIHPEDDISLEEFRASHHKYKYIPPQYSSQAQSYVRTTQAPPLIPYPPVQQQQHHQQQHLNLNNHYHHPQHHFLNQNHQLNTANKY